MAVATKKIYTNHPEGIYEATIGLIAIDTKDYNKGKGLEDVYKIPFETEDGEVWRQCSTTYSKKSFFGKLVSAALNRPFEQCPDQIDTGRLKGCKVKIFVQWNETDTGTFDNVSKVSAAGDPFSDE
jgi:hypothetical protein